MGTTTNLNQNDKNNSHNSLEESSFSRTQLIFGKEAMENLPLLLYSLEKTKVVGSTAFVPPAAGLIIASEVVRDLL